MILGLMAAPIMTSIAEDALKAVPDRYREAAEALGATRWQLVRHVLVEVVMLFLAGGVAGALFAAWLLDAVMALMPADVLLQAPFLGDLSIDAGVLGYGLALALACGALFGLIPALRIGASDSVSSAMASRVPASRPSLTLGTHSTKLSMGSMAAMLAQRSRRLRADVLDATEGRVVSAEPGARRANATVSISRSLTWTWSRLPCPTLVRVRRRSSRALSWRLRRGFAASLASRK